MHLSIISPEGPWTVIGLMSGTSLDGLDICAVRFTYASTWDLMAFETIPYDTNWQNRFRQAPNMSGLELTELHFNFGLFQAEAVQAFCQKYNLIPDLVSAHGHTVFHQPEKGFSLQIGEGESMASLLNILVVNEFRIKDIVSGGQGAPLVPAGERALFPEHSLFLNLGGIANIHIRDTCAYDVCPCNMLLNDWIRPLNLPYDAGGAIAAKGALVPELLEKLDALDYYQSPPPKSLGAEDYLQMIPPVFDLFREVSAPDLLHTACLHIAGKIIQALKGHEGRVLLSGGGVHHSFLISCLEAGAPQCYWEIAPAGIADAKEALIFAWLGLRTVRGLPNTSPLLTGSDTAQVSGSIHLPGNLRTLPVSLK